MKHEQWLSMSKTERKTLKARYGLALARVLNDLHETYPIKIDTIFSDDRLPGAVTQEAIPHPDKEVYKTIVSMLADENFVRSDGFCKKRGEFVGLSFTPLGYTFVRRFEVLQKENNILKLGAHPEADMRELADAFDAFVFAVSDAHYANAVSGFKRPH